MQFGLWTPGKTLFIVEAINHGQKSRLGMKIKKMINLVSFYFSHSETLYAQIVCAFYFSLVPSPAVSTLIIVILK